MGVASLLQRGARVAPLLPGLLVDRDAGQAAEALGLMPVEGSDEVAVVSFPEEPEGFHAFGETETTALHETWGKDSEEIPDTVSSSISAGPEADSIRVIVASHVSFSGLAIASPAVSSRK